jgi:bifunctional non-homologous end joining protein LigD
MRPMLASTGSVIPSGPDWVHEIKWDGMRVLADVHGGRLRLSSRNEIDVTVTFPELSTLAGAGLPQDMLLDGEVVALEAGIPSFGALSERMHIRNIRRAARLSLTRPVTFMVFDLLRLDNNELLDKPLGQRRSALEGIAVNGPHAQMPPTYDDGLALATATFEQGLEGVVSKRLSSVYRPGRRSPDWLKFPHRTSLSVVIGGWRKESTGTGRLGAVLVGRPTANGLTYLGRVGSGLAGREQERVLTALQGRTITTSPFADQVPSVDAQGAQWVRPEIVIDVRSLGLSTVGRLRQPAYRGLRTDLSPDDVLDEE